VSSASLSVKTGFRRQRGASCRTHGGLLGREPSPIHGSTTDGSLTVRARPVMPQKAEPCSTPFRSLSVPRLIPPFPAPDTRAGRRRAEPSSRGSLRKGPAGTLTARRQSRTRLHPHGTSPAPLAVVPIAGCPPDQTAFDNRKGQYLDCSRHHLADHRLCRKYRDHLDDRRHRHRRRRCIRPPRICRPRDRRPKALVLRRLGRVAAHPRSTRSRLCNALHLHHSI
jgi:hypothetical protein